MKHQAIAHWLNMSALLTLAFLIAFGFPPANSTLPEPVPASWIPHNVVCWRTEGTDFDGYTPAHILEREVIGEMYHKYGTTQLCGGIVHGRYMEWQADQPWIERGRPSGVRTGDQT